MRSLLNVSLFVLLAIFVLAPSARGLDLTNGLMMAVPTPNGPPALDGTDTGWDLSDTEPMWIAPQTAKLMHARMALNYDANNLYVYARISLEGPKLKNENGPADEFWAGDLLELRLSSDPAMPFPLDPGAPTVKGSNRICHMSFWKDTLNGKVYFGIAYGGMHGGSRGKAFNPPGSKVTITEKPGEYVVEAQIPWSALNVPGGKNPFGPGSRMTAIWGVHWGFDNQIAALYSRNPGAFAFLYWSDWGQVEFSPTGHLKPRHGTMEQALAAATTGSNVGVPITVDVPEAGKLSVNIMGSHGEVIRNVSGGQVVAAGKTTVYWDGLDQWGFPQPVGTYHWGAYFSHGLKARIVGSVGSSKSEWGGDHGLPSAVASDATGIYFGWAFAEAEMQIVKLDYSGKTLWRKSPFVQGGFPVLRALASNGKYLFGVYDGEHPLLTRLSLDQGVFVLFGHEVGQGSAVPIATGTPIMAPANSLPARDSLNRNGTAPECIGLAATATEVFASVYSQNIIQVLDAASGKQTRTLACPRPRGLTLDAKGNLYAVCFGTDQVPQVVRFNGVIGEARPVVTSNLVAPVGVAVDSSGNITVTDEGTSQQVKTFSPDGKLVRTLGKEGGRTWAGTYDPSSYLDPFAVTVDSQGGLDVAEASIPKIFDRIDNASGKTLSRWFGWPGYGVSNIGDAEDPMTSYYPFEPAGFARATVKTEGGIGLPDAYWDMQEAGFDKMYSMLPYVSILADGQKYFIDDSNPHAICRIEGDKMIPVNHLDVHFPNDKFHPEDKTNFIELWTDQNGDHKPQPDEITELTSVDGKPLPRIASAACSMWVDHNGDAYFVTGANSVLKIPATGFAKNGGINWDISKASFVVPAVLPSLLSHNVGGRRGMPGLRADSKGNIFTCLSSEVPVLTPELADKIKALNPDLPKANYCAYANADLAKHMQEGIGHTGESNIAKFAKYGPDGKLIWIAGHKATAAPNPGEMYHFWAMAGMVDDNYIAGVSEWGPIYFYTSDGYYVDSLMNDPATLPAPGPYTFGSETFGGRVQAFDKLKKVYAYNQGHIYVVDGFNDQMKVDGERRFAGEVHLDKDYVGAGQSTVATGLQIVPISGDMAKDVAWSSAPAGTLLRAGAPLATARIGYDATNLYARVHVVDDTPLQNGADDPSVIFKGGDVVGLDLGPAGDRKTPILGDVRILAANIHGQPRLIGMKPVSKQTARPQKYTTPASGTKSFDFVGDIPNGKVTLTPDADGKGYTVLMTVPRSFLEFPLASGTPLRGDIEVLLSGAGQRGLQAVARNWLYSGGHWQTTMVDDIPTEAWLYPEWWGDVTVK